MQDSNAGLWRLPKHRNEPQRHHPRRRLRNAAFVVNTYSASPRNLARVVSDRWSLIVDLTKRDALGRYSWRAAVGDLFEPLP